MKCDICGGEVYKLTGIVEDGKVVMRCKRCMVGINPSLYSTEKRWYHGQGYDFWASPAHIRDIKHRRLAEDGRSVIRVYK